MADEKILTKMKITLKEMEIKDIPMKTLYGYLKTAFENNELVFKDGSNNAIEEFVRWAFLNKKISLTEEQLFEIQVEMKAKQDKAIKELADLQKELAS